MGEIDHLLADPAVQAAIEAQRTAQRHWKVSKAPDPDPELYFAMCTLAAFARAGGSVEKFRNLAEPAMAASRRERLGLSIVRD
ncbi:hypothetical protein [Methylobacterium sp. J-070]|uniref:hypothetical protein n=1 Tax=Methylobacterium sp. J-070 TaxID=2836650 RepID=UPI001FB8F60E|nr:hypothetical protein [Methylobacterium sp. J-070]MCJ2049369.1 hypothetical protein [Methylobacterium sp. J-070]MCJ2052358.1 hypothetical protein [Methylobacterium sp. J-070]